MAAQRRVLNVLLSLAALVVIVAGLKAAQSLMLPVLFAIVLAILVTPVVVWLEVRRVPQPLAVAGVVLGVLGVLAGALVLTVQTAQRFTSNLDIYQERLVVRYRESLQAPLEHLQAQLQGMGVDVQTFQEDFGAESGMAILGSALHATAGVTLGSVADLLSNALIITFTLTFMLFETPVLPAKIRRAFRDGSEQLEHGVKLVGSVQRYLVLKTLTSAAGGILAGLWCMALGLDFPWLWGSLAFILHFIPTIGSIVASFPPLLLALVLDGPGMMLAVAAGYLVIHITIGNLIEPRIMGDQFGMSTLVVFITLVFWGWLWGGAGMLLAVPLTVALRNVLAQSEGTRWVAILMSSSDEPTPEEGGGPGLSLPDQIEGAIPSRANSSRS